MVFVRVASWVVRVVRVVRVVKQRVYREREV
jgi:hypothetical protein